MSKTDVDDNEITTPMKKAGTKKAAVIESTTDDGIEASLDVEKTKKVRHGKWVWLGILVMLVLTAIGSGIGYSSAMKVRLAQETEQRIELAANQFLLAEQDQQSGNLDMARQRLEYVLTIYPEYPGLEAKLTEVMMAISINNPQEPATTATEAAVIPVETKDTGVVSVLFTQAQNQLTAADWKGLMETVSKIRNIDPSYEPIKVDGMYYYALRYNGITKIQAGNLEVGLYYFAMAEQIAPLDKDVASWRSYAEDYLYAGSWYGIDWYKSADAFYTVYQEVPHLLDVSGFTAKQRYVGSLVGIGDLLMMEYKYCDAATQYDSAKSILSNDILLTKIQTAQEYCAAPPPLPSPTVDPNAPTP